VAVLTGKPAEPDQSGFLGMKFEFELPHPLSQLCEETPGIRFFLESDDPIIRKADDHDIASGMVLAPVFSP
jgi:hypothetical protein